MKDTKKILLGILLLVLAVLIVLNTFGITNIDFFFPGWWALFIIVPCFIGIFTERDKAGNVMGLLLGVGLLLAAQDVIDFSMLWKLAIPAIIIFAAVNMIIVGFRGKRTKKEAVITAKSDDCSTEFIMFGGNEVKVSPEQEFKGAKLTAIFGGIDYDLSDAVITQDCTIEAVTVFGGIDIILPKNVNVKSNAVGIFGGVENKNYTVPGAEATVYITGAAIFGGVDIKS